MDVALKTSVWVTSPEYSGWLEKKGFHWRKLWKKRWVALHGAEIAYMDEEPTEKSNHTLKISKSPITSVTIIDREDIDGHPNGFAIHVNDGKSPSWYLRADSIREKKSWLMRLSHAQAIIKWLDEFERVRVLGVGGTGIVYELLHKMNGQRYAMKEMEIKNSSQMRMAITEAEMVKDIMENISHPNIMHIEKVFQVGSKFYLVFPLCTGGELYEHVIRRGHFTEKDAAILMRDLTSGLHALHQHDILHLDVKPENILFESIAEDARIKITDFGLSKVFHDTIEDRKNEPTIDELQDRTRALIESGILQRDKLRGTVGYMSPELILMGVQSKGTDVWAAGVVLYILLCGYPPFHSKSNREVLERSAKGEYRMEGGEWDVISEGAKDLVTRMLTVDPAQRISTAEILAHPWILAASASPRNSTVSADDIAERDYKRGSFQEISDEVVEKNCDSSYINLAGALRKLSGHVIERRTEKLALTFTRLVSTLKNGRPEGSELVTQVLRIYYYPRLKLNIFLFV